MSNEFKPPRAKMSGVRLKKIVLEMTDGQNIELEVDGGSLSIDNGMDYDLIGAGILGYKLKGNVNQRITIEAFKGNPDYIDSEVTPMGGVRLFNREEK